MRDHFSKHREDFEKAGLDVPESPNAYDLSARETIQYADKKFKYQDKGTGENRTGYWRHSKKNGMGYFTGISNARKSPTIFTHYPESWERIRANFRKFAEIDPTKGKGGHYFKTN